MHFPFTWGNPALEPSDLERFAIFFQRAARDLLACEQVAFEATPEAAPGGPSARRATEPVIDPDQSTLTLPLSESERLLGWMHASGGDPALYRKRSLEWLRDRSALLCRELRLIKQWSADPVTGMANGRALVEELQMLLAGPAAGSGSTAGHLMLIEVYPRARNAEQGLLGIARIGSQIEGLIGADTPVYHLGAGVFAQLRLQVPEDQVLRIGNGLLRWLQRENLARGHLGIAAIPGPAAAPPEQGAARILEHAWLALGVARQRAPHALCTHEVLTSGKGHAFHDTPPALAAKLKARWRGLKRFGLILLELDQEPASLRFPEAVLSLAGSGAAAFPLSAREALLFLPGAAGPEVKSWLADFRSQSAALGLPSLSMGIALFPCGAFKKADIIPNARKALLHNRFFGPGSATFFDSASLNISGDVYYNEGDLARAIKEYRRGLQLVPDSVNLLNSLGVAYAQMNHYRQAIPLFEKVLEIEPSNFMALFNLGYAHLAFADHDRARHFFTRALTQDENNFDLLVQLGKLHCQARSFQAAAELLARAEQLESAGRPGGARGEIYFHLGLASKELGQHQQAIVHLQRAIQVHPHHAGAISLLGELYALEGQGEDIALALCRQAVEIDESRSEHWRRLALVRWQRGEEEEALAAVQRSLRLDRRNCVALQLLGDIFRHQGRFSKARQVDQRLLKLRSNEGGAERTGSRRGSAGAEGSYMQAAGGKP